VCFDNAPTKHQRAKKKNRDAAYESVFGVYQTEKEEEGWAHTREQLGPPSLPPSLSRFPSQRLNSHTPEEMEDRERERERERDRRERTVAGHVSDDDHSLIIRTSSNTDKENATLSHPALQSLRR
jgi:hypothetical protein